MHDIILSWTRVPKGCAKKLEAIFFSRLIIIRKFTAFLNNFFQSICGRVCSNKKLFESRENTEVSAAILCLVCPLIIADTGAVSVV